MTLATQSTEKTPLLQTQSTAAIHSTSNVGDLNQDLGGIDPLALARRMQILSSQINANSVTQYTVSGNSFIHNGASQALSKELNGVDPVIKRAIEMLSTSQQNQNPQQITLSIAQSSTQQTLSLPDGQYEGEVQGGTRHGRGTMTYHPGMQRKKYEGEWKNGKFEGNGVLKFSNETRYEGQWVGGQLHGHGIQYFADGTKYEGDFVQGKKHGKGRYRDPVGNTYEGDWENDQKHGHGKIHSQNGATYEGGFKQGLRHGRGTLKDNQGNKYVGEYENDKRHGQGEAVSKNCREVGVFRNGKFWSGKKFGYITGGDPLVYENGKWKKPWWVTLCDCFSCNT